MFRPRGSSHTPQTAHTLQRALCTVSLTTRMGCNLCTLQKREEHYKLLYEIAQVRDYLKERERRFMVMKLMTAEARNDLGGIGFPSNVQGKNCAK